MTNAGFDEHIKKQLADYQPQVPAHIWENISKEKDKRRPVAIWWMFGSKKILLLFITLLTGAGVIWYATENTIGSKPSAANNAPLKESTLKLASEDENILTTTGSNAIVRDQKVNNPLREILPVNNNIEKISVADDRKIKTSQPNSLGIMLQPIIMTGENNEKGIKENSTSASTSLHRNSIFMEIMSFAANTPSQLKIIKHASLPTPCPEMEKNTAANKKYFELYAGPDYAMSNFSDTGNSNYKQLRKQSTKTSFGFSAGVRYTKVFANGVSIRAGFNYSQVNEKFTYKQGNIVQVVYIINNNGDTTGSYTVTGTRNKSSINKYKMVDVPIMLGYEMGNEKIHVNLNAGVMINIHSWQKGNVVDTANNPVDISTGSNNPYSFKTNAGIGFTAAASLYYKINERLHLVAEPYFRYNLSQANKTSITLKQKFNTAGIRLGLRLDIP